MSGSTVSGVIASGSVVSGVPAKMGNDGLVRRIAPEVISIVARVFRLPKFPSSLDGPNGIAEWNSSGSTRLLVALEEAFGVVLSVGQIAGADNIKQLSQVVAHAIALPVREAI